MLDLSRLTDQQRQAVIAPDGPLLVVAGPGSGKTTVLAARIAHLVLLRNVSPATILAMTFTRAAAGHLRSRLTGMLREQAREVDIATFHAIGLRIIRLWSGELGFAQDRLTVYGEQDARTEIERLAQELQIEDRDSSELVRAMDRYRLDGEMPSLPVVAELTARYEALLQRRGAVDFTAMAALPLRLFASRPEALRLHQDAYRHLLADEFQDVSLAQYTLLRRLAEPHGNLAIVGDPAQSLYRWRGAGPHMLEAFKRDFPQLCVHTLDESFRSTGRIIAVGNAVGDEITRGRRLRTDNPDGVRPVTFLAADEQAEASYVTGEIRRLIDQGLIPPEQIAVLYRTNGQADLLGLALRQSGVAYVVRGRADLLGRKEVVDAVAYLRLAVNPDDALALARIINTPPRHLGRLVGVLRDAPVPARALLEAVHELGAQAQAGAGALVQLIDELHSAASRLAPVELLDDVLTLSGYRAWLEQQRGAAALASLATVRRLLADVSDVEAWLTDVQLGEAGEQESGAAVTLSTIHQSKGLEWRAVFIVGLEEGLLPHSRALALEAEEPDALDEEQRLAYVAVTRAREMLFLTSCRQRTIGDDAAVRRPSRFLRKLPRALLRPAA